MKKTIIKISVFALVALGLASCVNKSVCQEQRRADGSTYVDKSECSKSMYLLGVIPLN
jgi:hypothetical protein